LSGGNLASEAIESTQLHFLRSLRRVEPGATRSAASEGIAQDLGKSIEVGLTLGSPGHPLDGLVVIGPHVQS
jgi:hypothetical protein